MPDELTAGRTAGPPRIWDAIVIGAGPAGTLAAAELARRGLATLIVERKRLPRDKACGGCLNARAVAALRRIGAAGALPAEPLATTDRLLLLSPRRRAELALPAGAAVVRAEFDDALLARALRHGAVLQDGAAALVAPEVEGRLRRVALAVGGAPRDDAYGRVVLACDGLGAPSTARLPELQRPPRPRARVGAAAVVDRASRDLPSGTICLAFGQGGYVGRVRLGDDRMCVAAAVDPALLRRQGPLGALQGLLAACGAEELPGAPHLHVLGTLPLTRRARHVAAERLLLVGDACGYVEPLTGEGMAAAIDLALAAAPLAAEIAGSAWHGRFARAWRQTVRRSTLPRSLVCRALTGVARRPPLASAALAAVSWSPRTAARAVARMTHGAPSAAQGNPA